MHDERPTAFPAIWRVQPVQSAKFAAGDDVRPMTPDELRAWFYGYVLLEGRQSPVLDKGEQRRCIGVGERACGAAVQGVLRCRRCYMSHRYHTNPEVRRKQLDLQKRWRARQKGEG